MYTHTKVVYRDNEVSPVLFSTDRGGVRTKAMVAIKVPPPPLTSSCPIFVVDSGRDAAARVVRRSRRREDARLLALHDSECATGRSPAPQGQSSPALFARTIWALGIFEDSSTVVELSDQLSKHVKSGRFAQVDFQTVDFRVTGEKRQRQVQLWDQGERRLVVLHFTVL